MRGSIVLFFTFMVSSSASADLFSWLKQRCEGLLESYEKSRINTAISDFEQQITFRIEVQRSIWVDYFESLPDGLDKDATAKAYLVRAYDRWKKKSITTADLQFEIVTYARYLSAQARSLYKEPMSNTKNGRQKLITEGLAIYEEIRMGLNQSELENF